MVDPDTQALSIFDLMCATSADRPFAGKSVDELTRDIRAWQSANPALTVLRESEPAVHLAFLKRSYDWLKANSDLRGDFRLCSTLSDAIAISLRGCSSPLPSDLLLDLITRYGRDGAMSHFYFPFPLLLSLLTREQITNEIRIVLRAVYLQLAPSPNGKLEPGASEKRERIAELIRVEGEKQLDPGRGPWSQIVFDEISEKEPIARAGWEALLEHCMALQQPTPGAKWTKKAEQLASALGNAEVTPTLLRWLDLGPTPGQPAQARSPIEDSPYQKGVVWCLAFLKDEKIAGAIGDFGIACLRKIPMLGAVSQKVGLACVQALGAMRSPDAIQQLTRMQAKIKYSTTRRLIEKALQKAADRSGVSVQEIEDYAVEGHGLDENGRLRVNVGDAQASIELFATGQVSVVWQNASGKIAKSGQGNLKKKFGAEVRAVNVAAKEIAQGFRAQKFRLERELIAPREMPLDHWNRYLVEHPLLGFLGRRLVWMFRNNQGSEQAGIWLNGQFCDSKAQPIRLAGFNKVRLWHPLAVDHAELRSWRDLLFKHGIRQPFPQVFREFYEVTDAERETRAYSNRFAGILLRQHQLASLCREREWEYRLMGAHFDGANVPTKNLAPWKIHVEFHVDLPSDRKPSLRDSGLAEESGYGIGLFVGSDQVRFYRERREIAVDEVPAIVYSEIMRDVDLFTSVCAVGNDETWSDQGDRGLGVLLPAKGVEEITALISLRADLLARALPLTPIAGRCTVEKSWLTVSGQLNNYRISFVWGGVVLASGKSRRWITIPQKLLSRIDLGLDDVPIDLDYRTEQILRKAYLLADDWKIDSPDLVKQLIPE